MHLSFTAAPLAIPIASTSKDLFLFVIMKSWITAYSYPQKTLSTAFMRLALCWIVGYSGILIFSIRYLYVQVTISIFDCYSPNLQS
jgi:hypothetical protein